VRPLELVEKFLTELCTERIPYCHWKSNTRIEASLKGETDLDLLVASGKRAECLALLERLDFLPARDPWDLDLPGICHYYGLDDPSGILVHVHLHFQLILGDDLLKNYRLPVEEVFFESTATVHGIAIPSPEVEYIVFVLRMVLKRRLLSVMVRLFFLMGSTKALIKQLIGSENPVLSNDALEELLDLREKIDRTTLDKTLREGFPFVTPELFQFCCDSLNDQARPFTWLVAGRRLARALDLYRRHNVLMAPVKMCWQAFRLRLRTVLFRIGCRCLNGKTPGSGGRIVAIVGGNGETQTYFIDDLERWLGRYFSIARLAFRGSSGKITGDCVTSRKFLRTFRKAMRLRRRGMVVLFTGVSFPEDFLKKEVRAGGKIPLLQPGVAVEQGERQNMGVDEIIVLQHGTTPCTGALSPDCSAEMASIKGHRGSIERGTVVDISRPLPEIISRIRSLVWDAMGAQGSREADHL